MIAAVGFIRITLAKGSPWRLIGEHGRIWTILTSIRHIDLADIPSVSRLPDDLWGDSASTRRSRELTCLYVQRYSGPRLQSHLTDHPFTELLYVFAGEGTLRGPTPLPLRTGTAVLIPPRYPHLESAADTIDTLWIGLSGSVLPRLHSPRHVDGVELGPVMESIWLLGQWRYGTCGPELDGLCRQALGRFERLASEADAAAGEAELIHRATTYLLRHHTQPITVSILAAELGVSEGHLHRRFRAVTGRTPIDYLIDLRLASAMEMMRHSTLSLRKIARLTGFVDPLYFSRVCRKRTGHPPSHWRRGAP